MFHQLFNFGNNPRKRRIRILREAENQLIDGELALENATAYVGVARARVARLKSELGQPIPTNSVESVTAGDITHGSIRETGSIATIHRTA